jgi:hypothetical protein
MQEIGTTYAASFNLLKGKNFFTDFVLWISLSYIPKGEVRPSVFPYALIITLKQIFVNHYI